MSVPLLVELLLRRARHAGTRWLLVGLAVALAGLPLVISPAVARTTAAAALRRGVDELPAGRRSVIVSYSGLPDAAAQVRVDAAARAALAELGDGAVRRQVLFNALADRSGQTFRLAVTDRLATVTHLVSGRLPAACGPGRCEVVELVSGPATPAQGAAPATSGVPGVPGVPAAPTAPGSAGLRPDPALGLVVVGAVTRADPLLLGGTFDPGTAAPVLLTGDVSAFRTPAPLVAFGRAYGWVAGWDADRVLQLGVDAWIERAARAGERLAGVAPGAVLTAPDQVLRDQDERARLSAQRLGLLAAGSCAVLLGAAVIGGTALRRDHEGFADALRLRGAGRGVVGALLAGEALLAALLGGLGALLAGGSVAAVLAARAGLPVVATVFGSLGSAWAAVLALTVAAAAVVVAAVGVRAPAPGGGAGVWRALEAGSAGCLAAAALLVSRGGVTVGPGSGSGSGGGSGSGDDTLLTALPVLVLTASGLLAARCWPGTVRLAQRLPPRRALAVRLGLAAVVGRPARPAATAGVLTAAVATAVFAGAYAATLDRGAAEQAAHAVPLDVRLLPGPSLAPPLEAVPPDRLAAALPGATTYPVVRTAGSVRTGAQQADAVQLLGVDPAVLPRIARWSAQTGGAGDPETLARDLAPSAPVARRLPPGATLTIGTATPPRVVVTAYVRAAGRDGRERAVDLVAGPGGGLGGRLPQLVGATGTASALDLVALAVRLPTDVADRRQHALGEGTHDQAAAVGTLALRDVAVDGVALPRPWAGWSAPGGGGAVAAATDGAGLRLDYQLGSGPVVLVPPAAPGGPVPVLTDPATAAAADGGTLTLLLDGVPFPARPVATPAGFPTTEGRFAVLDADALADLVDRTQPGSASPTEVWVAGGAPASGAGDPLDRLTLQVRGTLEDALRSDPVARSATGLLLAGAWLGLAVALAAVVLRVVAERTDDAPVHYAWEADGVGPGTLRAALWWGAVATVVPAALAGVLTGVGLAAAAARLVAVTAAATAPQPPLAARLWDGPVLAATSAGVLAVLALAGLAAARSLREPVPVRRAGGVR